MEPDQTLNVGLHLEGEYSDWQYFYAKMAKDGRIYLPELVLGFLRAEGNPDLTHRILEVTLEPAQVASL